MHCKTVSVRVSRPEVLRAPRADVLVQVVPLVLLQSLVSKLHPAGDKQSIRMWRTQAVAVLDLGRLVRVPGTEKRRDLRVTATKHITKKLRYWDSPWQRQLNGRNPPTLR